MTEVIKLMAEGLTLAGVRRVLALQTRISLMEAELAAARSDGALGGQGVPGYAERSARRGE